MNTTAEEVRVGEELIEFLEALHATSDYFPEAVTGLWNKAVVYLKETNVFAIKTCKAIEAVLSRLQTDNSDLNQIEMAQSETFILLGVAYFWDGNNPDAIYYFEQGAQNSRRWGYGALACLAFLGKAICYKRDKNWPGTFEAAQKALDATRNTPFPDRSDVTQRLERQVKEWIDSITEEVAPEDTTTIPADDSPRVRSTSPILVIKGLGPIDKQAKEHGKLDLKQIDIKDISRYLLLDEYHRNSADFAVLMEHDNTKESGILKGDAALIQYESSLTQNEIGLIIIAAPEVQTVFGKYEIKNEKDTSKMHWFLTKNDTPFEALVVIPEGADVSEIQKEYAAEKHEGISYHHNARLSIVGRYVGLVRKPLLALDSDDST